MSTTSPVTLTFRGAATSASRRAWRELELRFEVITPVFGGGVYIDPASAHVKEIDRRTPVRFSEIRQQLRFWWRACHVHLYRSLSAMRERELQLFGSTNRRGAVTGGVVQQPTSCDDVEVFESHARPEGRFNPRPKRGYEAIAYGAFPLQHKAGMDSKTENGVLHALSGAVVVRLRVHSDDAMLQELRAACSAWLHLGGLGGRTRRGFGAVSPTNPEEWSPFQDDPAGAPRAEELQSVASLHGAARVTSANNWHTANEALSFGLRKLQTFRQGVDVARAPGVNKPSFSWWPEPDTLRRLFGAGPYGWSLHPIERFPRAQFGMPIIFDFRRDHHAPRVEKSELTPSAGTSRWPSPLILRPTYDPTVRRFRCIAIALTVARPTSAYITPRVPRGAGRSVSVSLTESEAASVVPLGETGTARKTDVVLAFLDFFTNS